MAIWSLNTVRFLGDLHRTLEKNKTKISVIKDVFLGNMYLFMSILE